LTHLAKAGGRAGAQEAITEAAQTTTEIIAGGIGTEKGVDYASIPRAALASALAGGAFGGPAGMTAAEVRRRGVKATPTETPPAEGEGDRPGLDLEGFKRRMRASESSGDDTATNPDSSATGRYQFIDATWIRLMSDLGLDIDLSRKEVLALRLDGDMQELAMDRFIEDNSQGLEASGLEATPATLKLAHILGVTGAIKLLSAASNTPTADVLPENVIDANRRLFKDKTAGQVLQEMEASLTGEAPPITPSAADATAGRRTAGKSEVEEEETPAETATRTAAEAEGAGVLADTETAPTPLTDLQLRDALSDESRADLTEQAKAQEEERASTSVAARSALKPADATPMVPTMTRAIGRTEAAVAARAFLRSLSIGLLKDASDSVQRNKSMEHQSLIEDTKARLDAVIEARALMKENKDPERKTELRKIYEELEADLKTSQAAVQKIQDANEASAKRIGRLQTAFNNLADGRGRMSDIKAVAKELALSKSDLVLAADGDTEVNQFLTAAKGTDLEALTKAAEALQARIKEISESPARSADFTGPSVDEATRQSALEASRIRDENIAATREEKERGTLGDKLVDAGVEEETPTRRQSIPKPGRLDLEYKRTQKEQESFDRVTREARKGKADKGAPGFDISNAEAAELATQSGDAIRRRLRKLGPGGTAKLNAAIKKVRAKQRIQDLVDKGKAEAAQAPEVLRAEAEASKAKVREQERKRAEKVEAAKVIRARAAQKAIDIDQEVAKEDMTPRQKLTSIDRTRKRKQKSRVIADVRRKIATLEAILAGMPLASSRLTGRQAALDSAREDLRRLLGRDPVARQDTTPAEEKKKARRIEIEGIKKEIHDLKFDIRVDPLKLKARLLGLPSPKLSPIAAKLVKQLEAQETRLDLLLGKLATFELADMPEEVVEKMNEADRIKEATRPAMVDPTADLPAELEPEADPQEAARGLDPLTIPRDAEEVAGRRAASKRPLLERKARVIARRVLRLFKKDNPGFYQDLLGRAAVVGSSGYLKGQARPPESQTFVTRDPDGRNIVSYIRGLKKRLGTERDVIDPTKPHIRRQTVKDLMTGAVSAATQAGAQPRDAGAVAILNDALAQHGLLSTDPSMGPNTTNPTMLRMLRDTAVDMGHKGENRVATAYDNALVDVLVQQADQEGVSKIVEDVKEPPPQKDVAPVKEKPDARPRPKAKERPVIDPGRRRLPDRDGEGGGLTRRVRVASADVLPERRPVAAAWLATERDEGRGLDESQVGSDLQLEAVDRIYAAHEDGSRSFLLADGTGFGKTREILLSALMIARKTGKVSHILVPNPDIMQRFWEDAQDMGIEVAPGGAIAGGLIKLHKTSGRAHQLNIDMETIGAVFVDESQDFQNPGAAGRQKYIQGIFKKTPFLVYATATPGDKVSHMVGVFAALAGKDPIEFARDAWGLGMHIDGSGKVAVWSASFRESARAMYLYIRNLHHEGQALSRQFISEAEQSTETIQANDTELAQMAEIENGLVGRKNYKQLLVNALKRFTQSVKAKRVLKYVKQEIAEGRKVVIMASENTSVLVKHMPRPMEPMYKIIEADLEAAGIRFVTYIGEEKDRDKTALETFQNDNDMQVIITNAAAGGRGIDLDDHLGPTLGGKPRTMILADLDWSGTVYEQVVGRVERKTSQTRARIITMLMENAPSDVIVAARVDAKRKLVDLAGGYQDAVTQESAIAVRDLLGQKPVQFGRDMPGETERRLSQTDAVVAAALTEEGGSLRTALEALSETSDDPQVLIAADALLPAIPETTVRNMTEDEEARYPGRDGMYIRSVVHGGVTHEIAIRRAPVDLQGTILHEAAHAAGSTAIDADPMLRRQLENILARVREAAPDSIPNAKLSVHELWSDAMSDPVTQAVLESIPMTRRKSVWGKIKEFVAQSLRRFGILIPVRGNLMDRIVDLNILDRDSAGDERALLAMLQSQYGSQMTTTMLSPVIKAMTNSAWLEVQRRTNPDRLVRKYGLRLLTGRQLLEQGKPLFETAGGNAMSAVQRVIERTNATIRRLQKKGEDHRSAWVEWANINRLESRTLDKVMLMATLHNLDPSDPKQKAPDPAKNPEGAAVWAELQTMWATIGKATTTVRGQTVNGQTIFTTVRDYYRDNIRMGERTFIATYLTEVMNDPAAGVVVPPQFAGKNWMRMIEDPNANEKLAEALAWVEKSGGISATPAHLEMVKMMSTMMSPKERAVYFPLRRHGQYVANYQTDKLFSTAEEADAFVRKNPGARIKAADPLTVDINGFELFERFADAQSRVDELNKIYPGIEIEVESLRDMGRKPSQINDRLLKTVNARLASAFQGDGSPAAQAQLKTIQTQFRDALIDLLLEGASQKSLLTRKGGGVMGASSDMKRIYAERVQANAFHMAQMRHSKELFDARQRMAFHAANTPGQKLAAQEYVTEMDYRLERDAPRQNMPRWVSTVMDLGYVGFLVGPSFSIINSTQPLLNTWPHLASQVYKGKMVGPGRAAAAMYKAYNEVGGPVMREFFKTGGTLKTLGRGATDAAFDPANFQIFRQVHAHVRATSPLHAAVLQELADRGEIDQSAALDLRGAAQTRSDISFLESRARYFVEWSRQLPHMVEVLNRSVTGIAAYEVARNAKLTHNEAVDAAADAVTLTQYNYADYNKVPWMKIPQLRPFLMFMQFPQHMYYYWFRSAKLAFKGKTKAQKREGFAAMAWMFASHAIAGGVIGALFEPIKIFAGALGWLFTDDDEPWDTETETRNAMADLFGIELGDIVSNGLPALVGMNFQGRLGISDMLFFNPPDISERGGWETMVYNRLTGPMGQVAGNVVRAVSGDRIRAAESTGDYLKVFESVLPKALKDALRTYRYADEGVLDSRGHVILDTHQLSPWDLFQQSVGLQPNVVSQAWEARNVGYDYRQTVTDAKRRLLTRFNKATPRDRAIMRSQEIPKWNQRHPEPFARITGDTLARSQDAYRSQERSFFKGIPVKRTERQFMRKHLRFSPLEP
jgi:hypothetical protein